jgi:serine/threonine protein kinase
MPFRVTQDVRVAKYKRNSAGVAILNSRARSALELGRMAETIYLGHYRVCTNDQGAPDEVSRSGAAVNYKAVDLRSGELVMLQLIPLAAIDPSTGEQFEQRARTVEKLDHINIAKLHETGIDQDRFVMASEYLAGETADSWVITHGPMAPDAVFRTALQIVRAIAAAAFHGLTHRAIQPANIMLLPDAAPEGGGPLVKLLNFGVAGVALHSESDEARELAPSLPPQFASPEQLRGGEIDFRSEIYSLGATMCFLLAGAVPLASGRNVRARLRALPELRRTPRRLRKLLGNMLEEDPNRRPQDPVVLEKEIQKALGIAPTHQIVRALTPVAPVLPEQPIEGPTPLVEVRRGIIAVAALLLIGGAVGVLLSSNAMPWRHRRGDIGKAVGVPERSTSAAVQPNNAAPVAAANQPPALSVPAATAAQTGAEPEQTQSAPPAAVTAANATNRNTETESRAPAPAESSNSEAESRAPAPAQSSNAEAESRPPANTQTESNTSESAESSNSSSNARHHAHASAASSVARSDAVNRAATENSTQTAAPAEKSETVPPAQEGPADQTASHQTAAAGETITRAEPVEGSSPVASAARTSKKKTHVTQTTRKSSEGAALDPALAAEEDEAIHRAGQVRAQYVGTSEDGRLLLRLPSGKIVTVTPRNEKEHAAEPRRHRRATEPEEYPRAEPLKPEDEPQD